MTIAVNTTIPADDFPGEYGYFIYESFKEISGNNPDHQFVFITNKKNDGLFQSIPNAVTVVTSTSLQHTWLWKYWYNVKIPAILKKYKADVFVSCDGVCSLTTDVPQCLFLYDLSFFQQGSFIKKAQVAFYKKNLPLFLEKAAFVTTVTEFSKQEIISQYKTAPCSIAAVFSGAPGAFQPLTNEEKQLVKTTLTEGREYFLYTGEIHPGNNVMKLVKAFSVFKKRQQTGMKLVLCGKLDKNYTVFKKDLASYKYRNDVVLADEEMDDSEKAKITGAAYGFIYPSLNIGFAAPVVEAIQSGVPVIISAASAMQDILKEGALYAAMDNHTDIADKMMLLYKDENKRKELIEKNSTIVTAYNRENSARLFRDAILKAAAKKG